MSADTSARETAGAASRVRILSYNIRHGQGIGGLLSNSRVAQVIGSAACDVAGLNEVWRIRRSYDQPRVLGELTGMQPVFHSLHSLFGREIGNLALSRLPIASSRQIALGGKREPRGCLVLELEASGVSFEVALVHLSLDRATRAAQLEQLAHGLDATRPLVVVGDFNCPAGELEPLARLVDFPADVPATYPSVLPLRALDHIGFSDHWELVELRAIPSWASDHRPLLAELRLSGAEPVA